MDNTVLNAVSIAVYDAMRIAADAAVRGAVLDAVDDAAHDAVRIAYWRNDGDDASQSR